MFNLSSAEGPRFAQIATEMTERIRGHGPQPAACRPARGNELARHGTNTAGGSEDFVCVNARIESAILFDKTMNTITIGHQHSHLSQNRVLGAIAVTGVILAAEVVGGILTNSLALLSDAGHMLTDLLALGLSYFAISIARRPPTDEKTYGFHRMEILAALANGVTLVVICLLIFYEAYQRISNPPEVKTTGMLIIAVIGLVANLISAVLLSGHAGSLNVRGAFLHVVGDALSSVGIIIGGRGHTLHRLVLGRPADQRRHRHHHRLRRLQSGARIHGHPAGGHAGPHRPG